MISMAQTANHIPNFTQYVADLLVPGVHGVVFIIIGLQEEVILLLLRIVLILVLATQSLLPPLLGPLCRRLFHLLFDGESHLIDPLPVRCFEDGHVGFVAGEMLHVLQIFQPLCVLLLQRSLFL